MLWIWFVLVLLDFIVGMIDMVSIARVGVISIMMLADFDVYASYINPTDLVSGVLGIVPFDTISVADGVLIAGMLLFSSLLSLTVGGTFNSVVVRFCFWSRRIYIFS